MRADLRSMALLWVGGLVLATGHAIASDDHKAAGAPGLYQSYVAALEQAPIIRERQALARAGDEVVNQAKALRLPNVSVDARYTDSEYETGDVRINPRTGRREQVLATTREESYNYGVNLTQPIYDRGVSTNLAEARARRGVADAELTATRKDLAAQVAEAYLRILRARAERELAQAEAKAYMARWRQMQERVDRALSSRIDVLDARVEYETALSDIARARNDLDAARLDLKRLTGTSVERLRAASLKAISFEEAPSPADVDEWLEQAATASPGVAVARERLEQARETVSVRQAERFPRLSLEARYSDTNATDQLIQGTDARVLLRLQVPIFSGGGLTAGVDEARARRIAQSASLDNARRQAAIDAQAAVNELKNAQRRVQVAQRAVTTATTQVEAAEQGLSVGLRDEVAVFEAQARLYRIRRDLAEAAYDYLIARVRLQTIIGAFEPASLRALDRQYLDQVVDLTSEEDAT